MLNAKSAGLTIFILASLGSGPAAAEKANCIVTSGVSNVFKFVTLKCAFAVEPQNFVVRATIWESEDPEGYRKAMRASGRKAVCELTEGDTAPKGMYIVTHYKISDCH